MNSELAPMPRATVPAGRAKSGRRQRKWQCRTPSLVATQADDRTPAGSLVHARGVMTTLAEAKPRKPIVFAGLSHGAWAPFSSDVSVFKPYCTLAPAHNSDLGRRALGPDARGRHTRHPQDAAEQGPRSAIARGGSCRRLRQGRSPIPSLTTGGAPASRLSHR